jgi:uncharacterized repeat protein (TIGR03987 family)
MLFSIIMIILALGLYSIAIWSEKFLNDLLPWMIGVFSIGFICDLLGTSMMFFHSNEHHLGFHTICGYTALLIMGLHLVWAITAIKKQGKTARLFSRFSIYAWCIWLIAFVTGIPN